MLIVTTTVTNTVTNQWQPRAAQILTNAIAKVRAESMKVGLPLLIL